MPDDTMWLDRLSGQRGPRPYLLLLLLAALLLLPMLGRYGLWDPHEVRVAEVAREMAHTHSWTVPARYAGKPILLLEAIAFGYRFVGNSELGGRLPVALLSIATLLACFYAGSGLLRRRAALLGSLALLTMPVFFLGARQLTSAVAPLLGTTLAIGGLARAAWPAPEAGGERQVIGHLLVGLLGLALAQAAAGFGLGVAVPLLALTAALWAAGDGPAAAASVDGMAAPAPASSPLGFARLVLSALALGALALTGYGWWQAMPTGPHPGYSWILGGAPHMANHQVQATSVLKPLGFGAFPWVVLAPLGAAPLLVTSAPGTADRRQAFGRLLLLVWAVVAYLGTTLFAASVGDTTFGAYAAVALLAGAFLDDACEAAGPQALAGLAVIAGAATLAHDFFMAPEGFVGAHVIEGIKWPPVVTAPAYLLLVAGLLWAALLGAALILPTTSSRWLPSRRALVSAALGTALALTVLTIAWVVPQVSQHLSMKGLFVKYKSIVGTGSSEIGKYHVPGQLSDYGKTTELTSLPQMFDFLGRPERVFVITGADDLPGIDQYAKQRDKEAAGRPATYFVIDDSNSKFLMLSNRLGGEQDKNPLRRFVLPVEQGLPHPPQFAVRADFEGKVELVGYDLPLELERGRPFKITLYYKVNQPIAGGYRIFIHFDGPGSRFNGDHTPLDGKFPTNYWVPGFYVIDEFTVTPDRVTQPSGTYTLYSGFWAGDQRLKVVAGPSDGENRVRMGTLRVR